MTERPRRIDHPSGAAWYVSKRETFPSGFFSTFTRAAFDAGMAYKHTGQLSSDYPFTILGEPFVTLVSGQEFGYRAGVVKLMKSGNRFENLALRLRLLQAEYECFLTQREMKP